MSWAAHELEAYVIQKHVKVPLSFLAVLIGSWLPDMFTKFVVYGFSIGGFEYYPEVPAQVHRDWPGLGFTHSLLAGVVVALVLLWLTKHRGWALGMLLGYWAHVFTDMADSVGCMVFFPFTTHNFSISMWAYAAQEGRYGDAAAYYSSLGGVWDMLWIVLVLMSWRVLTPSYFHTIVKTADPVWGWLKRRFGASDVVLIAIYRSFFLYGALRAITWTIWAQGIQDYPWDISWTGPSFVEVVRLNPMAYPESLIQAAIGLGGVVGAMLVLWPLVGRRLWQRAARSEAVAAPE